jgi:phosphopantetheine--protein transferase-like protein
VEKMGIGIDIVEIDRIDKMVERWGEKFLNRVFTDGELREWKLRGKRMSFIAGRFATKEAFVKATSSKVSGWKDIEVLGVPFESPSIRFQEIKTAHRFTQIRKIFTDLDKLYLCKSVLSVSICVLMVLHYESF